MNNMIKKIINEIFPKAPKTWREEEEEVFEKNIKTFEDMSEEDWDALFWYINVCSRVETPEQKPRTRFEFLNNPAPSLSRARISWSENPRMNNPSKKNTSKENPCLLEEQIVEWEEELNKFIKEKKLKKTKEEILTEMRDEFLSWAFKHI